ncbi:hypothetical protein [Variovorax sp. JS1663]|uniref:hypothetical protein n=1 Tax=Variovorax sp. JS1663 TaxID=1851577 RepID=UPI000B63878E|nr:hypothetical protein [Variovorax sp. JS1663]OUM01998.1 hypothetical protein A8M77_12865 [Variovorax sp. JS1663]
MITEKLIDGMRDPSRYDRDSFNLDRGATARTWSAPWSTAASAQPAMAAPPPEESLRRAAIAAIPVR